jgi:hypothetical protein
MTRRGVADSVVEYGIQTLTGKTILMLTNDLTEAEHTLDLIGEGRLVQRTVRYSPWVAVPSDRRIRG